MSVQLGFSKPVGGRLRICIEVPTIIRYTEMYLISILSQNVSISLEMLYTMHKTVVIMTADTSVRASDSGRCHSASEPVPIYSY